MYAVKPWPCTGVYMGLAVMVCNLLSMTAQAKARGRA